MNLSPLSLTALSLTFLSLIYGWFLKGLDSARGEAIGEAEAQN